MFTAENMHAPRTEFEKISEKISSVMMTVVSVVINCSFLDLSSTCEVARHYWTLQSILLLTY